MFVDGGHEAIPSTVIVDQRSSLEPLDGFEEAEALRQRQKKRKPLDPMKVAALALLGAIVVIIVTVMYWNVVLGALQRLTQKYFMGN